MSKKTFWIAFAAHVIIGIILFLLGKEGSAGLQVFCIVNLYEIKNVYSEKQIWTWNPIKQWYKWRNKLKQYKRRRIIGYIFFILFSIWGLF